MITLTLHKDKTTKGAVRYAEPKKDNDPHSVNVYLTKAQASELGDPESVKLTVEPVK